MARIHRVSARRSVSPCRIAAMALACVLVFYQVPVRAFAAPSLQVAGNMQATEPSQVSAFWPGYGSGSNIQAPTPTGDVEARWVVSIKDAADWQTNVSDPIYVGDHLYIAAGAELRQLDPATGVTIAMAQLVAPIDSIARMLYADGVIMVPLSGGRLQAVDPVTMQTPWTTDALPEMSNMAQQSLTTPVSADGAVYFGTAAADWSTTYGGYLVCVDTATGDVRWRQERAGKGYYWAGAALCGPYLLIGDDAGMACVHSRATGELVSSVSLGEGAMVRSTIVPAGDGQTFFAVTSDGVLHRLTVDANGMVAHMGSVKFAKASTCTPAVADGMVIAGGQSEQWVQAGKYTKAYRGVLAAIDAQAMTLRHEITQVDGEPFFGEPTQGSDTLTSAEVKSALTVAQRGGKTCVYFTSNNMPGGVYRYCVGEAEAHLLYTPEADRQNFCMGSVVAGPDGSLHYLNDSGSLFALRSVGDEGEGDAGGGSDGDGQGGAENDNTGGGQGGSGNAGDGEVAGSGSSVRPSGALMTASKKALKGSAKDRKSVPDTDDEADEPAEAASTSSSKAAKGKAFATASQTPAASTPSLALTLPVAGMVVGVSGLGAIGFWLFRRRG